MSCRTDANEPPAYFPISSQSQIFDRRSFRRGRAWPGHPRLCLGAEL